MNLTPKQEAFCLAYMETGNASEAYGLAGYSTKATPKTINEASSRLLKNSNIIARLSTLRERAVERTLVTVEGLTADLLRIAGKGEDLAEASGLAVARASFMDVAKLNGLIIDKKLLGSDPDNPLPTGIDVTFRK